MALCSFSKSFNELALGQQRALGHRSALLQQRRFSVRTCVAQPSTSSATPNAATFELREALLRRKHFTQPQAETMLNVFPTMKDVASKDDIKDIKDDIIRLEHAIKDDIKDIKDDIKDIKVDIIRLERAMNSRFDQVQLLAVQLALAVVVILGLVAGALMLLPLNPCSAFGMVVSAFIKKNI